MELEGEIYGPTRSPGTHEEEGDLLTRTGKTKPLVRGALSDGALFVFSPIVLVVMGYAVLHPSYGLTPCRELEQGFARLSIRYQF